MTQPSKRCFKCGETKPIAEFSKNRTTRDGLQGHCKECQKKYYARTGGSNRRYFRKYRYGVNDEQYEAMLAAQNNACALCGSNKRLSIDHDHETEMVRGILCMKCNFALGWFEDDPERIRRAVPYVEKGKQPCNQKDAA